MRTIQLPSFYIYPLQSLLIVALEISLFSHQCKEMAFSYNNFYEGKGKLVN